MTAVVAGADASASLLRSLVANIPGAVYRCACDERLDDAVAERRDRADLRLPGRATSSTAPCARSPASSIPTTASRSSGPCMDAVAADRPYTLEYRIVRRDGGVRWVLERGQAQEARRWPALARRRDLRHHDRAARRRAGAARARGRRGPARRGARVARADPRGRRPRTPGDRAQPPRRRPAALRLHRPAAPGVAGDSTATSPDDARGETRRRARRAPAGLAELRDLAHGLHPAVLSDRGLEHALSRPRLSRRGAGRTHRSSCRRAAADLPIESAAYFTVCESLTNVAKYAQASRAWVIVERATAPRRRGRRRRRRRRRPRRGHRPPGAARPHCGGQRHARVDSRPREGTVVRASLPVAELSA